MPDRQLAPIAINGWLQLADLFENVLGGSSTSRQAAAYLRGLARQTLPANSIPPLPWHSNPSPPEVVVAREEPHPVVLATLSPSVPLRAVWKRRWWFAQSRSWFSHTCFNRWSFPAITNSRCSFGNLLLWKPVGCEMRGKNQRWFAFQLDLIWGKCLFAFPPQGREGREWSAKSRRGMEKVRSTYEEFSEVYVKKSHCTYEDFDKLCVGKFPCRLGGKQRGNW